MCLVSYVSWTPWLTQPFVAQGLRYWQICNGIFASTAFRARAFQAVASQATSSCNCNSRLFKVWLPFLSFNISSWVEFLLGLLHVKLDCCVQTCLDSHGKIRYSNALSKCSFEKQHSWQFRIGWITQKPSSVVDVLQHALHRQRSDLPLRLLLKVGLWQFHDVSPELCTRWVSLASFALMDILINPRRFSMVPYKYST